MATFLYKLRMVCKIFTSKSSVVLCTEGYYASVHRYDDKHFWKYAADRLRVLQRQHNQISAKRDAGL